MVENKEKLISYLQKNLVIAEEAFNKIDILDNKIDTVKTELMNLMVEREALGDKESAAKDVNEIKGFIESLTTVEDEVKEKTEPVVEEVITEDAAPAVEEAQIAEETPATPVQEEEQFVHFVNVGL